MLILHRMAQVFHPAIPLVGENPWITEYGIAVNPRRPELAERLRQAGLDVTDINILKEKARSIIGDASPLPFGDKVVGVVMNRDGNVMDVIKNIND